MSKHLLHSIELAEREYTERERGEGEYVSGFCPCCGSDCGLDEDENACGYCAEGRELLREER